MRTTSYFDCYSIFNNSLLPSFQVQKSENSGLVFQKSTYFANIVENSTKIITVAVVNLLGSALNEHIQFRLLNPTDMFVIGETSGAIRTAGKRFDREHQEHYSLIVEVSIILLLQTETAEIKNC